MNSNQPIRYCACGARLARDNRDTRCSPCQQKTRDLALRPPQVPPEFWDTDQLRDAFAHRHMGQVVYAYRHHPFHGHVLPQELVGGWLGIGQTQLSRIEHGPPISDLDKLIFWAQTLRIPARLLWFDLPGQRRDAPPLTDQGQVGDGGMVPDGDGMMVWVAETIDGRPVFVPVPLSRRKVLAAGGAGLLGALGGVLDPDELGRVEAAVVTPARADLATVGHLEALLAHYRRLDDQLGPRGLLTPVQATLGLVNGLRKAARPPVRQALLLLSAQYEQLTGWLHSDSGDHTAAERAYERALGRATEAGDHAFVGYVLARKSEQATTERRTDTALNLAQAAQAGEGQLTPAVRAHNAYIEARAWALDGKPDECRCKLDEAVELLAASAANGRAEEPPWIYYFTEEYLEVGRGTCFTDLGEAGPAIQVFDHAIPALPPEWIRERAYSLLASARAHSGDNDPDYAGVVAQEAARIAIGTGSGRILQKLRGLHTALSKAHKDVRAVRDLGDLLRPPGARPGTGATPHE